MSLLRARGGRYVAPTPPPPAPPPAPPPGAGPSVTLATDYAAFLTTHLPDRPYALTSTHAAKAVGCGVLLNDDIANQVIGTTGGVFRRAAMRFRSKFSANLTGMRHYWAITAGDSGYSAGTGGAIRLRVYPDNGSGLPNEAGTIFSETIFYPDLPQGYHFFTTAFTPNAPLVAGTVYHLTAENIDADPAANRISFESSVCYGDNLPASPVYEALDWVMMIKDNTNGGAWWAYSDSYAKLSPITELHFGSDRQGQASYAGGNFQGPPERTFLRTNALPWRTRIIPTSTRTWYGGAITCNPVVAGHVDWTLTTSGGTELASGSFSADAADDVDTAQVGYAYKFNKRFPIYFGAGVELTSGSTYYVTYTPRAAAEFRVVMQTDGRGEGFSTVVTYEELTAQHYRDGAWSSSVPYNHALNSNWGHWREWFMTS